MSDRTHPSPTDATADLSSVGDASDVGARSDVMVIGDIMVDVVAAHREPIESGTDVSARITVAGGGSAANTACWLASFAETPRLLAAVGDDDLGRRATSELAAAGVTMVGPALEGESTGTCVVLLGSGGERTMLPDRAANDRLPVSAVVASLDPLPGWVHLCGYALLGEGSRNAGKAAISAALAAGCVVSVDAASAAALRSIGAKAFLDWIEGASIVLADDDEIGALGGVQPVLARVSSVAVKHGSAGATWTDGVETALADGLPVDLIDTTGAGDAFAAGWIAAIRSGDGVHAALTAAVAAGATAVSLEGGRPT
jgi:sugar/nucleoside kinase (ribokinase family)